MEYSSQEGKTQHSFSEINNEYACQKLLRRWIQGSNYPSNYMIQILHAQLMGGVSEYQSRGLTPLAPGRYRNTEVSISDKPSNFFVNSLDVVPTMQRFTNDLDERLGPIEVNPSKKLRTTLRDASWAYYTFGRIHPYLDGNGRVGRMIMKRIIKGAGYKDIVFQPNGAYGKGREAHLDAVNSVDATGNLAHLELYLLEQLKMRYQGAKENSLREQIDALIMNKKQAAASQTLRRGIDELWNGFKGLNLDGVRDEATDMSVY